MLSKVSWESPGPIEKTLSESARSVRSAPESASSLPAVRSVLGDSGEILQILAFGSLLADSGAVRSLLEVYDT